MGAAHGVNYSMHNTHFLKAIWIFGQNGAMTNPWDVYHQEAKTFFEVYESKPFEVLHADLMGCLPEAPGTVLDLGAGSGRDAAWFADIGFDVVAVEPAEALRSLGQAAHSSARIQWMGDHLPDLGQIYRSGLSFDLIWLAGVWMHVPPGERARAFRKLAALLNPGGRLVFSLRQGPVPPGRIFHPVSADELEAWGSRHGLSVLLRTHAEDALGREGVSWTTLVLQLPEDGTGALTLIRSLILRDRKSSSYKLALLRVLGRIAETHPGTAREEDGEAVELPLGLVALYWLRAYLPLARLGLPQHPQAASGFTAMMSRLKDLDAPQLRPGVSFHGQLAVDLHHSLVEAAQTIRRMPATYLTHPGTQSPIFGVRSRRAGAVLVDESLRLDQEALWAFGSMTVPSHLWRAFRRWGPWIEPLLRQEWAAYMESLIDTRDPRDLWRALTWVDPQRDTREVRTLVEDLRARGQSIYCVWSGRHLQNELDIDHCLPLAAWPCQDLWNMLPFSATVNRAKGDKLVTPERLEGARERLLEWWDRACIRGPRALESRFRLEAQLSLAIPEEGGLGLDRVFHGLAMRRMALAHGKLLSAW